MADFHFSDIVSKIRKSWLHALFVIVSRLVVNFGLNLSKLSEANFDFGDPELVGLFLFVCKQ